jgi:hypothetical protein
VSTTNNTLKGRGSGIKAKRTSAKARWVVSLAVIEERKHWQAVTSIDGTAMVGAHPARLPRKWQHGRHGASKGAILKMAACQWWERDGFNFTMGSSPPRDGSGVKAQMAARVDPGYQERWFGWAGRSDMPAC